jgi:hypothetical protein
MTSSSLHWRLRVAMVFARQKLQFGLAVGFALGCLFSSLVSAAFPEQLLGHRGQESNHYPAQAFAAR